MSRLQISLFCVLAGLLAACEATPGDEDWVTSDSWGSVSENRLSMNRLSMNRLSMNRLSMNGLLDPATGEAGAEVIKYSARCMLRADQSVQVDYVDASGAVGS